MSSADPQVGMRRPVSLAVTVPGRGGGQQGTFQGARFGRLRGLRLSEYSGDR